MKKADQNFFVTALLLTFMLTKTINVMQDTEEIWKDIIGYEGCYHVSNTGFIKSVPRNGNKSYPIILKKSGKFYDSVTLQKNGIVKRILVHRLVALSFIDNPENKPQVNHINGIKKDNHVKNLEWVTRSENEIHAHRTGLKKFRGNHGIKLTAESADRIRYCNGSQREIAKQFGVSQPLVFAIKNNKIW